MGKELNYPRQFIGSQTYKVYQFDLSTERTDEEFEFPFDVTVISIVRNDAEDDQVLIKLDDSSNDPIPLPKIEPPESWSIVYSTRKIYLTNPSVSGVLRMVVFG